MNSKVEKFKEIAIERWEHQKMGNARKGNKCYDRLHKIYDELREDNQIEELCLLLNNEDDGVKFEAAQWLLPHYPEEAKRALEEIVPKWGLLAFEAKETLKWWKKKEEESQ